MGHGGAAVRRGSGQCAATDEQWGRYSSLTSDLQSGAFPSPSPMDADALSTAVGHTKTKPPALMAPPPTGGRPGLVLVCKPPPPPHRVLNDSSIGAIFVTCFTEGGTMPLVLKTLKTFFLAKTRNC